MSFDLKSHKDNLLFIPLGGTNEIGMNLNVYHFQGKLLIVDCGSGFSDEATPGADMVVADIHFLTEHKKDILGMFLTHAHEDHLGGVPFLWSELQCPIYTTDFTASFLKIKLSEFDIASDVKITTLKPGGRFDLGPFDIELAPLTHSAPEMQALMIRTKAGNILHTGDWKFDPDPVVGNPPDLDLFKSYGDEGVLALVCDSTNVLSEGHSGSEGALRDSLVKLIAGCPNLVVVTTFASNLARLDTIIHAAKVTGRKVVLTGKSLHRMTSAAQDTGYLEDAIFLSDKEVKSYPKEKLLVIATGCQGEPLAAVNKMADNNHPYINLSEGDTVIFSSKIIPGNDKRIFRLFNQFIQKKIEVITEKDHFVHVSGHPCIDELKKMYELIRPDCAVPVHGEPIHIHEHGRLAKAWGIKSVVEVRNGSVAHLCQGESRLVGTVKNGYFAIDGNCLIPNNSDIFKFRRRMRDGGLAIITLVFNKHYDLATEPVMNFPGVLSDIFDGPEIKKIKNNLVTLINKNKPNPGSDFKEFTRKLVVSFMKKIFQNQLGKKPITIINIENARV